MQRRNEMIETTKANACLARPVCRNLRIRRKTALLSLLLILALPAVVQAQFNYVINNGTITITRYWQSLYDTVIIPSTIDGLPVVSIGPEAFSEINGSFNRLTSVTIPETVNRIEDWTFHDCTSLSSVVIGNAVASIE